MKQNYEKIITIIRLLGVMVIITIISIAFIKIQGKKPNRKEVVKIHKNNESERRLENARNRLKNARNKAKVDKIIEEMGIEIEAQKRLQEEEGEKRIQEEMKKIRKEERK